MAEAIRAEGLVKNFGKTKALAGTDLYAERGTVLGVLGPNGAGKTTAVRILTTLLPPDGGRRPGGGAGRGVHAAGARHRGGLRPAGGPGISSQDVTDTTDAPALVQRAVAAARQVGFPVDPEDPGHGRGSASLPGTGRFLAMLAAGCRAGRIAELGTGTGIGAAWMSAAMPPDCTLVTAELDPVRAAAAAQVLAGDERVTVLTGDAAGLIAAHGPFDLIFADSGVRDAAAFGGLVRLLKPGGRIVMDDVTPVAARPAGSPLREHDVKRELFAGQPGLTWTEVVLPDLANSLLVGTRG